MGRKKANHADRRAELYAVSRMAVEPPDEVDLNDEELAVFQAITNHRSPLDWTSSYELLQAAQLAQLEVHGAELWLSVKLLGAVDPTALSKRGAISAEMAAFDLNLRQRMTVRRFLKLVNSDAPQVISAHGRAVRRTGAIIDAASDDQDDDDSLLASAD